MGTLRQKRFIVALAVVAALAAASPARAESRSGSVILAAVSPTPTRALYNAGVNQNAVGVVVKLPASADGASYTLSRTSGAGQLDAWFYMDNAGSIGEPCRIMVDDPDGLGWLEVNDPVEHGVICPNPGQQAGWAIIVLRTGANAGFTLTW